MASLSFSQKKSSELHPFAAKHEPFRYDFQAELFLAEFGTRGAETGSRRSPVKIEKLQDIRGRMQ